MKIIFIFVVVLLAAGCSQQPSHSDTPAQPAAPLGESTQAPTAAQSKPLQTDEQTVSINFADYGAVYKFKGSIPADWKVEYVQASDSINIYDPAAPGTTSLEQSQIFMRHFKASTFLTLSTVNVLSREEAKVNFHSAVKYEIEKKSNVPPFSNQPSWRSARHKLIDIRSSAASPTEFFVIAYNPALPEAQFNQFIQSLVF